MLHCFVMQLIMCCSHDFVLRLKGLMRGFVCLHVLLRIHAEEHAQRPSATEEAPFQAAAAVDVKVISQHAHLLHGKVCFKIVF